MCLSNDILSRYQQLQEDTPNKLLMYNLTCVLTCLCDTYYKGPDWVLDDLQFSIREEDCISVDWLTRNLYCCVYPDLVAVDQVSVKNVATFHREKELTVLDEHSIKREFISIFSEVSQVDSEMLVDI